MTLPLNQNRRAYLYEFLEKCGYCVGDISDADETWLFQNLARTEELASYEKYDDLNWEWKFASQETRANIRRPAVDEALIQWFESGKLKKPEPEKPRWPEGRKFALCLSHDVDVLQRHLWRERSRTIFLADKAGIIGRGRAIGGALRHGLRAMTSGARRAPLDLAIWVDIESEFDFRSTFFFVPNLKDVALPHVWDCYYRYSDPIVFDGHRMTVGEVMRSIVERGWEVGLHGSIRSSESSAMLRAEKASVEKAIGQQIVSNRQHYLRFDARDTPRNLEDAGFRVDSSLGSNLDYGFRAGTGLPFRWYDLEQERTQDLIEVPLVVQEMAVIKAANGDEDGVVDRTVQIMERVADCNGAMTLLWHNNHDRDSLQFRSYARILKAAHECGAWGCSVRDMAEWWTREAAD